MDFDHDLHNPNDIRSDGHLMHNLLLFGRLCHTLGLNVTPYRMLEVSRTLEHIDLLSKRDFYYTLRTFLVNSPRDIELFDIAFNEFWKRPSDGYIPVPIRALFRREPEIKENQFLPSL